MLVVVFTLFLNLNFTRVVSQVKRSSVSPLCIKLEKGRKIKFFFIR